MVNKIVIIGNLGDMPEFSKVGQAQRDRVEFSVATKNVFKRKDGEKVEEVDWHRCEGWGGLIKICEHLKKGTQVYVEGRQRHVSYTNDAGETKTRSYINVHEIKILSKKEA